MTDIQPYVDYFSAHPVWAIILIFLTAFGEALLIIGLFVPSTIILVGAGTLVGSGHLSFWPVFIATTSGAILGDQVSYWIGWYYGDRLKSMWPLSHHPQLVERGEEFVKRHGVASIAIGRFVPGVKAVVPGVVGMLNMDQRYFLIVNVLSSIVWAAAHVLPGMVIGQGLSFAGELSGRLALVLLILLVAVALAGWLIRLVAASLSTLLEAVQHRLAGWAKSRGSRTLHRFGRAVSPGSPRGMLIIFFLSIMAFSALVLGFMTIDLLSRTTLPNGDVSAMMMMRELRNSPADKFMIPLAMLGDPVVLAALALVTLAWLLWHRAWRAGLAGVIVMALGLALTLLLYKRSPPPGVTEAYAGLERFAFMSGHVTMTAIVFGSLAVLVSHSMGRWPRSMVYGMVSVLVGGIAFAVLYLGIQWFSGIVSGLLLALILVSAYAVIIEGVPPRRISPGGLLIAAGVTFLGVGLLHINRDFDKAELAFAPPEAKVILTEQDWQSSAWRNVPAQRIDLAGKREENFSLQWAGDVAAIEPMLRNEGWVASPHWTWKDALRYLDPASKLADVVPRPSLHEGLQAVVTLVKPLPGNTERAVFRLFKTSVVINGTGGQRPLYLGSLTSEHLVSRLHSYVTPVDVGASSRQVADTLTLLSLSPKLNCRMENVVPILLCYQLQ